MQHVDGRADAETGRRFCLARRRRLVYRAAAAEAAGVPEWRRLAQRSAFSVFRDCVALGAEEEARAILAGGAAAVPGPGC
jgi:hypothetical protein